MSETAQELEVAAPLDDIERRILEATIELAVGGGYDAVRQRDVAARAKVALATVYARFASKDILLSAALDHDCQRWLRELDGLPARGRTPLTRVTKVFEHLTHLVLRRPKLARASLRAATSGDHEAMLRQMVSQQRLHAVMVAALRGPGPTPAMRHEPAQRVVTVLTMVWYANLTAWAGGVLDEATVVDIVRQSAEMLLYGVQER